MQRTAKRAAKSASAAMTETKRAKSISETERGQKFWVSVASKDHVTKGVEGCFGQACHGKGGPLARTREGDWIIYYSPKQNMTDKGSTCKHFTAIGRVTKATPYQVEMTPGFKPFRIDIEFEKDVKEISWTDVREKISFASMLRFGFAEITEDDFKLISQRMLGREIELSEGRKA